MYPEKLNDLDVLLEDVTRVCRVLIDGGFPLRETGLALQREDLRKYLGTMCFETESPFRTRLRKAARKAGFRLRWAYDAQWGWLASPRFERRLHDSR